jgi:hypothetical protein
MDTDAQSVGEVFSLAGRDERAEVGVDENRHRLLSGRGSAQPGHGISRDPLLGGQPAVELLEAFEPD